MSNTVILNGQGPRIHITSGAQKSGSILVISKNKVSKVNLKDNTDIKFAA